MKTSSASAIAVGQVGGERAAGRRGWLRWTSSRQARLVDRDLALLQALDLGRDLVDADHVVAALGEAGAGDQADVSGADDCDFHEPSLFLASSRGIARRRELVDGLAPTPFGRNSWLRDV